MWWGALYPTYPVYSVPVIVRPTPPVVFRPEVGEQQYWHYCENPRGYYPHIQQCPSGWLKVVPN